jgi:30S ribosomal protein S31
MGKGDKRTKRGKIFRGTFGKFRPKKVNKEKVTPPPVQETSTPETAEVVEEASE